MNDQEYSEREKLQREKDRNEIERERLRAAEERDRIRANRKPSMGHAVASGALKGTARVLKKLILEK